MNKREKWGLFLVGAGFYLLLATHIGNIICIVNGLDTQGLWFPILVIFGGGILFLCGDKE